MYICILDGAGQVLLHHNAPSTPAALLEIVAPYREDPVVAAECMFTWYWLADVCAAEGLTFVLGSAQPLRRTTRPDPPQRLRLAFRARPEGEDLPT